MDDKQTTLDLFSGDGENEVERLSDLEIDTFFDVDVQSENDMGDLTLNTSDLDIVDATLSIDNNFIDEESVIEFDNIDNYFGSETVVEDYDSNYETIDNKNLVQEPIEETIEVESIITKTDTEVVEVEVEKEVSEEREKIVNTKQLNSAFNDFKIVENQKSVDIAIKVEEEVSLVEAGEFGIVNIMVVGVGGCGCNAINRMFEQKNEQIKLVAIDTSEQTLENISSDYKLLLGEDEFKGHGSGGDVAKVESVFDNNKSKIQALLKGVDMVFLAGGIGRGTGSIGLIKIGQIAREMGILTIGFATLPRKLETNVAILEKYYPLFSQSVDSTIIVENERVGNVARNLPIMEAMKIADSMLVDGIRGVFELITKPGKINLDYADIKTAFADQGSSVMGIGYGKGEGAVVKAIENAFKSEIVDFESVKTAKTIIFNITCSKRTVTIDEASKGTDLIYSFGSYDNIKHLLFGYSYDENLMDEVKVTFIATGTTPAEFDFTKTTPVSTFRPTTIKTSLTNESVFGEVNTNIDSKQEEVKEEKKFKPDFFKKN